MVLDCDLICREFVKKNYGDLKTRNPTLPVLIRECSGVQPQLWARYGKKPSIPSDLAIVMVPGMVCSTLLIFGTIAYLKCEMFLLELPDPVTLGDIGSGGLRTCPDIHVRLYSYWKFRAHEMGVILIIRRGLIGCIPQTGSLGARKACLVPYTGLPCTRINLKAVLSLSLL